jgi:hypothetical protein
MFLRNGNYKEMNQLGKTKTIGIAQKGDQCQKGCNPGRINKITTAIKGNTE